MYLKYGKAGISDEKEKEEQKRDESKRQELNGMLYRI